MKVKVKDIEKQILDALNDFTECNFKANALKELQEIHNVLPEYLRFENLEHIVEQYPDFNSLNINIMVGSQMKISFYIVPSLLQNNKKAIRKLAKMICSMQG